MHQKILVNYDYQLMVKLQGKIVIILSCEKLNVMINVDVAEEKNI